MRPRPNVKQDDLLEVDEIGSCAVECRGVEYIHSPLLTEPTPGHAFATFATGVPLWLKENRGCKVCVYYFLYGFVVGFGVNSN